MTPLQCQFPRRFQQILSLSRQFVFSQAHITEHVKGQAAHSN